MSKLQDHLDGLDGFNGFDGVGDDDSIPAWHKPETWVRQEPTAREMPVRDD